jgi:regulatory protein
VRRRREPPAEARARRAAVDDPAVVLDAALRFLEARQRSVHEVRRRLTGAGYRADLVDGAIERLGDLGVLDDSAFAQAWVESRDRAHPRGARALRQELRLKGIDASIAETVLDERASGSEDVSADVAAAERLLARSARVLARVADPRARRQRAFALLARNGFESEIAREVATRFAAPAVAVEDDAGPDGEAEGP